MNLYLFAYNAISALAWVAVLLQNFADSMPGGYYHTGTYTSFPHKLLVAVQTLNAAAEVFHSVSGLVPSPLLSLLLQCFARLVITVGISYHVPHSPGNSSWAYFVLTVAWATSDIIRYVFFAWKQLGSVPSWLLWARYLAFLVLYPLGLASEPVVVYRTLLHVTGFYFYFLAFGMLLYVPGFFRLYGYMLRQRKRHLRKEKRK